MTIRGYNKKGEFLSDKIGIINNDGTGHRWYPFNEAKEIYHWCSANSDIQPGYHRAKEYEQAVLFTIKKNRLIEDMEYRKERYERKTGKTFKYPALYKKQLASYERGEKEWLERFAWLDRDKSNENNT